MNVTRQLKLASSFVGLWHQLMPDIGTPERGQLLLGAGSYAERQVVQWINRAARKLRKLRDTAPMTLDEVVRIVSFKPDFRAVLRHRVVTGIHAVNVGRCSLSDSTVIEECILGGDKQKKSGLSWRQAHLAFAHRQNHDESWDSICLKCYQTIANGQQESSLKAAELDHKCEASISITRCTQTPRGILPALNSINPFFMVEDDSIMELKQAHEAQTRVVRDLERKRGRAMTDVQRDLLDARVRTATQHLDDIETVIQARESGAGE